MNPDMAAVVDRAIALVDQQAAVVAEAFTLTGNTYWWERHIDLLNQRAELVTMKEVYE